MKENTEIKMLIAAVAFYLIASPSFADNPPVGADNQRDDLGYYYMITGGKFPTGSAPNGDNASGGTFRFLVDDPSWGGYTQNTWNKDDWFPENASFAVTLMNGSSIVYDNNGIEDSTYGNYYDATGIAESASKPGLYRGYAMSNNYDWIYAGYFKLESQITIDKIIGYYDENSGFDSDSTEIAFDMNIWSAFQDNPEGNPDSWMPSVNSFTGDVFSAKSTPGSFTWSDTGVDRVFGDNAGNLTDDIHRLVYTLDTPIVLEAGVYFFSHDAEIVPEPTSFAMLGLGGLALMRRRRA